jgi:3-oxoacyl-[acyl-carrier-protein] synthase III
MKVYITAIDYYLPQQTLTNGDLSSLFPEWGVNKIAKKIGIEKRHIAASDEFASDMAINAAEKLFKNHGIQKDTIDFLLYCTQSPDYFLPTTACIIQHKLGIPVTAGALDFNLGCSGYVYGLAMAKGLVSAGIAKNVLLITSETYTKFMHSNDKSNRTIFGDAAAATLVSTEGFAEINDFILGTDGAGAENLIVKNSPKKKMETTSKKPQEIFYIWMGRQYSILQWRPFLCWWIRYLQNTAW